MTDAGNRVLIYGVEEIMKTTIFLWPAVESVFWAVPLDVKNSIEALK